MKKYQVKNYGGLTFFESNHMYECESYISENESMKLTIRDNRPEKIRTLNAMSKEIAEQIERAGGVNPSYENLVSKIMNDPDNVWIDETDSVDLMESFVSLQQHVLECLRNRRPVRRIIRDILSKN